MAYERTKFSFSVVASYKCSIRNILILFKAVTITQLLLPYITIGPLSGWDINSWNIYLRIYAT